MLIKLNRAFLGKLLDALEELLTLHGVLWLNLGKVLRREYRNRVEQEFLVGADESIADSEVARIENTDDVACESVLNDVSVLCHELLRLCQGDFIAEVQG